MAVKCEYCDKEFQNTHALATHYGYKHPNKPRPKVREEDTPFYGKQHTEKTKKKMSEGMKKRWSERREEQEIIVDMKAISYLSGVLDSDGTIRKRENRSGQFRIAVTDRDFIEEVQKNIEKIMGEKTNITLKSTKDKWKNKYRLSKSNKELYKLLNEFSVKGDENCDEEKINKRQYLRGVFDGDGWVKQNEKWNTAMVGLGITNIKIFKRVTSFLKDIGIKPNTFFSVKESPRKNIYTLSFSKKKEREIFNEEVGLSIKRKQKALKESLKEKREWRKWKEEEIELLKENPKQPARKLAKKLDRTESAIHHKRNRL